MRRNVLQDFQLSGLLVATVSAFLASDPVAINVSGPEVTRTVLVTSSAEVVLLNPSQQDIEGKSAIRFLSDVASIFRVEHADDVRFFIYDHFDRWLTAGQFDKCNLALLAADFESFDVDRIMAFVGAAAPAADSLVGWRIALRRAWDAVADKIGAEEAETIFAHLA